jgi:NAD-dependent SIR2 family protein deacetylase
MNNDTNIKSLNAKYLQGKKIALFIGAGASVPLGIDDWETTLIKLGDKAGIDKKLIMQKLYSTEYNFRNHNDDSLNYNPVFNGPEVASEIYSTINDQEFYVNLLSELFTPSSASYHSLHVKILQKLKQNTDLKLSTILTTNFDVAFEKADAAFGNSSINKQILPVFNQFDLGNDPTIVYLHGNLTREKYILRKEEYETYYPTISNDNSIANVSHELEEFLSSIFRHVTLIFIGFSFQDVYFSNYFIREQKIIQNEQIAYNKTYNHTHPREIIDHYVILDENKEKVEYLQSIGLKTITLGEKSKYFKKINYSVIETILDEIFKISSIRTQSNIGEDGKHA